MLRDYLEKSGQILFRRRGWLPLFLFAAVLPAFLNYSYPSRSHAAQEAWNLLCLGLASVGQVFRFVTIAHAPPRTSGRNRRNQVADVLNTEGTYSIVRNPLYLGNCLSWLGLAAVPQSFWLWICVGLVFWLYHERVILAEEAFLADRFGEEFESWAARTPAFLPNMRLWIRPTFPCSFRAALGREYVNWFTLISAFAALDAIADSAAESRLRFDPGWAISWGIALLLFVVVRFLRKRTNVLNDSGRVW